MELLPLPVDEYPCPDTSDHAAELRLVAYIPAVNKLLLSLDTPTTLKQAAGNATGKVSVPAYLLTAPPTV